jgi:hypothetical protein
MVLFAFGKTCHLRPVQSELSPGGLRSAIPHALSSVSQDVGGRVEWKYEHKNALPKSPVNLPLDRLRGQDGSGIISQCMNDYWERSGDILRRCARF